MGQAVCEAVEGAEDMELVAQGRPGARASSSPTSLDDADVVVDFTTPTPRSPTSAACLAAGVHVVVGTTGFDLDALREAAEAPTARPTASSLPTSRSAPCC